MNDSGELLDWTCNDNEREEQKLWILGSDQMGNVQKQNYRRNKWKENMTLPQLCVDFTYLET